MGFGVPKVEGGLCVFGEWFRPLVVAALGPRLTLRFRTYGIQMCVFSKIRGTMFRVPYNKDLTIQGATLGPPIKT